MGGGRIEGAEDHRIRGSQDQRDPGAEVSEMTGGDRRPGGWEGNSNCRLQIANCKFQIANRLACMHAPRVAPVGCQVCSSREIVAGRAAASLTPMPFGRCSGTVPVADGRGACLDASQFAI